MVLRRAGCRDEKMVFILDESNIMESSFLERMNTLLANGEVCVCVCVCVCVWGGGGGEKCGFIDWWVGLAQLCFFPTYYAIPWFPSFAPVVLSTSTYYAQFMPNFGCQNFIQIQLLAIILQH